MRGSEFELLIVFAAFSAAIGFFVLIMAGMFMTFKKMGYKDAWWIFIPVLNIIFMLQVTERPVWWILLLFIPCVGHILAIILQWELCMKVSRAYGGGAPLALGLFFLGFIFFPYLGFFSNPVST